MRDPVRHRDYYRDDPQPARPPALRTRGAYAAGKLVLLALVPVLGFFMYKGGRFADRAHAPEGESRSGQAVENPVNDGEWRALVAGLENASYNYGGYVGIFLKDLGTGRVWAHNPDRLFPSASLIKVPIMASVFEKIKGGDITLDTQVRLTRRLRAGGSGSLKWVRDGTSLSVMEIIHKMITESDNTATKMLVDYVGLNFLQSEFEKLGLTYTKVYPEGFSLTSGRVARENYTTAREMAGLLERIYRRKLIDTSSSDAMLEFLKQNKGRSRLRKGLPMGWEVGHKTGLLRRSCHDVGIVFSPRGDYIIAVLTGNVPDYSSAKGFIAKVAKLTYEYYKVDADYASSRSNGVSAIKSI